MDISGPPPQADRIARGEKRYCKVNVEWGHCALEAGDTNLVSFVSAQPYLTVFPEGTSLSLVFTLVLTTGLLRTGCPA